MSRSANCWDNSATESFFTSLKVESADRRINRTRAYAKADVFNHIEVFHNGKRRHSSIGYVSPMRFEQKM